VKQFLSKGIASQEQTRKMLEPFDNAANGNKENLDPGRDNEITLTVDDRAFRTKPTGLALPPEETQEGTKEGTRWAFVWEPGECALVDENQGENREGLLADKTSAKEPNREPQKGSDASLAKVFLDSVEGDNDKDITTIGILKSNETDQDNNITTRARVHTLQRTVAEGTEKGYSVNEPSIIFKINSSKLRNTNFGKPS
jgi:hypothetical protein